MAEAWCNRSVLECTGFTSEWKEAVLDRAKSMYERDKNHASVLIWSCGNESYCGEDIAAMSEYFRSVDPTRPVHYEGVTRVPTISMISSRIWKAVCTQNRRKWKNT